MSKYAPKSETVKPLEIAAEEPKVTPSLTRVMLGTYWDPSLGEWMWASVRFDPKTLATGEVKTERVAGNSEVMMDQIYIKQINYNFFEKEDAKNE